MLAGIVQYANFIVYGSMAVIWITVALPNLIALYSIGKEFKDETNKLRTDQFYLSSIKNFLSGSQNSSTSCLQNSSFNKVKSNFAKYVAEVRNVAQNKNIVQFVDITDYFNIAYIDEIARTNLCDLIPGAMTGLGILGTFMGLIAGITGFSTDSSENIAIGINSLLGGMNTAFMTSIVGVIASLLFSFIHKPLYSFCVREMENYIVIFHMADLDKSSKKLENQLLIHEKNQTKMLQSFSGVIAKSISDAMKAELIPAFREMKKITEDFVNFSSEQQKASLEKIVNEFVNRMNQLLGGQLEELGQTVEDLSLQIRTAVNGICKTSGEVENINKISQQTINEMKSFVKDFSALIDKQAERNIEINNKQAEKIIEIAEKVKQDTDQMVKDLASNINSSLEKQFSNIGKTVEKLGSQIETVVNGICSTSNDVASINKISQQAIADMGTFITGLNDIRVIIAQDIEAAREQVTKNAQINEEQAKQLQKVAAQINEEASAAEVSISIMRQYCQEKVTEVAEDVYKRIEQANESVKRSLETAENIMENNKQYTSNLVDSARDNMDTLVKSSAINNQQMIKVFQDFSEQIKIVVNQAQASTQNSIDKADDIVRQTNDQINSLIEAMEKHIQSFYQQQMNN